MRRRKRHVNAKRHIILGSVSQGERFPETFAYVSSTFSGGIVFRGITTTPVGARRMISQRAALQRSEHVSR